MKRLLVLFAFLILSVSLFASCDKNGRLINNNNPPAEPSYDINETIPITEDGKDEPIDENAVKITVTVNGKEFTAALEDNVTAEKFADMLPMTVDMTELNENEKYIYLDSSISASPQYYGSIKAGDIMLYGDNCLVIFYESFQTIHSYTRIGRISDCEGLKEALGTSDVTVTFAP